MKVFSAPLPHLAAANDENKSKQMHFTLKQINELVPLQPAERSGVICSTMLTSWSLNASACVVAGQVEDLSGFSLNILWLDQDKSTLTHCFTGLKDHKSSFICPLC